MAAFSISNIQSTPRRVAAGGIVMVSADFRAALTGLYGTPGTSIQIAIYDPVGTNVVSLTGMTASATGQYYYLYATATSLIPGEYTLQIQCVDGGNTSRIRTDPGDPANLIVN